MPAKVEKDNFYVYIHKRKDNDQIFYVGKGKNKRYISISGRNLHWKNTSKKYGWYAVIINKDLTEEEALRIEEEMINKIGLVNLCNKNYFNGGKSGYKHSLESKLKMSIAKKGHTPWNKGSKSPESSIRMQGKNNPMFGKKMIHSQETLLKLRQKNGTLTCDLETGIFYDSIIEMAFYLNRGRKSKYFKSRVSR
jgi:hypothetical protein